MMNLSVLLDRPESVAVSYPDGVYLISRSGYETARSLAYHGCRVVFACRNPESARTAIERIKSERANSVCETLHCDLASLASVSEAAAEFMRKHRSVGRVTLEWGEVPLKSPRNRSVVSTKH